MGMVTCKQPYPNLYGVERLFPIDPRQSPHPQSGLETNNVNKLIHASNSSQKAISHIEGKYNTGLQSSKNNSIR